jgi:hypothetical protein
MEILICTFPLLYSPLIILFFNQSNFIYLLSYFLLLSWVWIHCSIYKSSYNLSNLNSPPPPLSFIHSSPDSWKFQQVPILHLHTGYVHTVYVYTVVVPNFLHVFLAFCSFSLGDYAEENKE